MEKFPRENENLNSAPVVITISSFAWPCFQALPKSEINANVGCPSLNIFKISIIKKEKL